MIIAVPPSGGWTFEATVESSAVSTDRPLLPRCYPSTRLTLNSKLHKRLQSLVSSRLNLVGPLGIEPKTP